MRSERYIPYLLVLPSVIFLLFLFAWPLVEALLLSVRGSEGWTLEHFQRMAADLYFKDAVKYTVLLAVVVVPLQVILALGMAMLLGGISKGRDLFLYVWTIPLGISDLAAGLVWLSIFTERGYLNSFLQALGLIQEPRLWLSYETPAMLFLAVVAAEVWRATAIVFVILVAGLQLIPKEYGEAAEVFGATPWRRFWRVTLPLLMPSLQVALILRTILALEVFAVVVALGGRNLPVLAGEAYFWYNAYQNPGVAAAYAVLILGISGLATLLYLRLLRPRQEVAA
ncbi:MULTISPECIES: carbohydrate ABC transporter permease [unclassified Meiothermus]|uniref:carbohydrate ABC transporter permease n=1 Tax=unclassified Meiothermus TaxID=370471 RepID=UPI000D7C4A2E|nr:MULTISPECIES: sugar ABC transporter permease [unclassified Meiothermus]PZA07262.1 sugar ABC transporter permease [Meiothermus sp. Pnk-1]RYM37996.1 sugar ABC transporter permease [Meiothermus sp. PNK-Is4]